jgi:signal transduction histidine kinase
MGVAPLVERLSELMDAAAAVVGEVDLSQVLRRLVKEAKAATGAEYAALGVIGPHGVLTDFIYDGINPAQAERIGSLPRGRGVLGTVVREKRTIILEDISEHPDSYGFPEHHPPMRSFLGVPVRAGGEVFGNLYLTEKPDGFVAEDVVVVEALAVIAGSAINTAALRERLSTMAVLEDRHRIARDLHDSIIQDLFAIGLSLQGQAERAESEASAAILHEAVDRLDDSVEALRSYIYELRSVAEGRPDLGTLLGQLVDRMAAVYPSEVATSLKPVPSPGVKTEDQLVRVAQEAVSNALRHSGAKRVELSLMEAGGEIVLEVADTGVGFEPESVNWGMGLANMRERVESMGGSLQINTAPGRGTTVLVTVPAGR